MNSTVKRRTKSAQLFDLSDCVEDFRTKVQIEEFARFGEDELSEATSKSSIAWA